MKRLAHRALLALVLAALALPALAGGYSRSQLRKLETTQQDYATALRWEGFEQALNFVDPAYRRDHPVDALHLERYRQLQVSGYHELGSGTDEAGNPVREAEIGIINRNTQAERTVRVRETWRWDPQAKRWWQVSGLPDLWDGR
ncbi:hypothetical protein [Xanthomonas massiliensis]|jgi:hypothetical protein|uniref:hypothetical protein n=1 Tax=Xanthomonas massiliensis TaxID=1720302 RepID=UPI000826D4DF|nr:hypothetical protein [Xanthomonas massiliensis]